MAVDWLEAVLAVFRMVLDVLTLGDPALDPKYPGLAPISRALTIVADWLRTFVDGLGG